MDKPRPGHPVQELAVVAADDDVHRVVLNQIDHVRKVMEHVTFAADWTLQVAEIPAGAGLAGSGGLVSYVHADADAGGLCP